MAHNHERPEVDQVDQRRIRPTRLVALACSIPQRVVRNSREGKQKVHDRKADYGCCAREQPHSSAFDGAKLSSSPVCKRTPFARCSAEDTSERLLHALPQPWVVCGGSESWFLQQGRMGSSGLRGAGASRSRAHVIYVPKQGVAHRSGRVQAKQQSRGVCTAAKRFVHGLAPPVCDLARAVGGLYLWQAVNTSFVMPEDAERTRFFLASRVAKLTSCPRPHALFCYPF